MKAIKFILSIISLMLLVHCRSSAQTTTIIVRAKARDAKFIGDGMNGAMITIQNTSTGAMLARGLTKGGTGDTEQLVKDPIERYETLSTPDAAKFEAHLRLHKPTLVTIKATANRKNANEMLTTSTQKWIIPGKDIIGDGVILEIPGFAVNNQRPDKNKTYSTGEEVPIQSHIVMLCGCSTKPGGLWDSSKYEIKARITRQGQLIKTIPLSYTGKPSLYKGSFVPSVPGVYQIWVYAYHIKTGNTGVDKTVIKVRK